MPPNLMWMLEATKKAAVNRAMRGISSSRRRRLPSHASNPASAIPPSNHGGLSTPSEMCTASSIFSTVFWPHEPTTWENLPARTKLRGSIGRLLFFGYMYPQGHALTQWILRAVVVALAAVADGSQAPPAGFGKRKGIDAIGIGPGLECDQFIGRQLLGRRRVEHFDLYDNPTGWLGRLHARQTRRGERRIGNIHFGHLLEQGLGLKHHPRQQAVRPRQRHDAEGQSRVVAP